MIGCKRCGECCRWHVFYFSGYDYDYEFVGAVGGKIVGEYGEYTMVPSPCRNLAGNDCVLYPNHPPYCRNWPKADEPWVRAMGCRFFDEE